MLPPLLEGTTVADTTWTTCCSWRRAIGKSQLNQNARSRVGAIGIMQVMPATGKDMRVGDITQTDPAIHAGTKFLRATINEYYPKESMDPLNKGLFAFAANNAGPGRVGQLRKLAGPARPFESQRSVQQGRVARGGEDWPGNCDLRL
jgi:membrane-bound lytic murein transglycosylase MltF